MKEAYDRTSSNEVEIKIPCLYDMIESTYARPSSCAKDSEISENFQNFWDLSVYVNFPLVLYLVQNMP